MKQVFSLNRSLMYVIYRYVIQEFFLEYGEIINDVEISGAIKAKRKVQFFQ